MPALPQPLRLCVCTAVGARSLAICRPHAAQLSHSQPPTRFPWTRWAAHPVAVRQAPLTGPRRRGFAGARSGAFLGCTHASHTRAECQPAGGAPAASTPAVRRADCSAVANQAHRGAASGQQPCTRATDRGCDGCGRTAGDARCRGKTATDPRLPAPHQQSSSSSSAVLLFINIKCRAAQPSERGVDSLGGTVAPAQRKLRACRLCAHAGPLSRLLERPVWVRQPTFASTRVPAPL